MYPAKHLISRHVVTGSTEQRLVYLSERIKACDAHYCAVLKLGSQFLVGIVRFSDVAANPASGTRILSELMQPKPTDEVLDDAQVERVIDALVRDPHVISVVNAVGEFVGFITPDSFLRWLGSIAQPANIPLEKIPANSRWHPKAQANAGSSSAPPRE